MNYTFERWPELEWGRWKDTAETLHMFLQIAGKTRLALTPVQNHWWNIPLYLTARGLGTSPMPFGGGQSLDIEFDFLAHELRFRTSTGSFYRKPLLKQTVKSFFSDYRNILKELGVEIHIDPVPVEVAKPVRFDADEEHASYDSDAVTRFWHMLRLSDFLLKDFSTRFYGKISPVHFFWGSMDLAVTRFSGRRAPARPGADAVQAEAYSHEVISAGFWPGNGGYGQAAFYAYAAPVPPGLSEAKIPGPGAFSPAMGEFVLNYADVLRSAKALDTVMQFLESTYAAAADAAGWDRANLDRHQPFSRRPRHLSTRQQTSQAQS
jgi:hypothetical protein